MNQDLSPAVAASLRGKRLVFTVATGRCGTAYLAHLLSFLKGVRSEHEPVPEYHTVFRAAQGDPAVARAFLVEKKLPAIAAVPERIYAEASHLFCKGFVEPFLDLGLNADLILLSRSRDAVASSLYRSGTIPGRSERAGSFYLGPEDPVFVSLPGWEDLHDYQLCLWYILEVEARANHYEELFRNAGNTVARFTLEEIRSPRGFVRLFRRMGLPGPGPRKWLSYLRYGRVQVNAINPKKKDKPLPENWEELTRELLSRVESAAQK